MMFVGLENPGGFYDNSSSRLPEDVSYFLVPDQQQWLYTKEKIKIKRGYITVA